MERFYLRFKHHINEIGFWNTTIYAETEEEAIEKAYKIIREENLCNASLSQHIYIHKLIK